MTYQYYMKLDIKDKNTTTVDVNKHRLQNIKMNVPIYIYIYIHTNRGSRHAKVYTNLETIEDNEDVP